MDNEEKKTSSPVARPGPNIARRPKIARVFPISVFLTTNIQTARVGAGSSGPRVIFGMLWPAGDQRSPLRVPNLWVAVILARNDTGVVPYACRSVRMDK